MTHEATSGHRRRPRGLVLVVGVVLAVLATLGLGSLLPSLSNPFGTETVDRSGPVLLTKLTDLNRFLAASGTFQELVDLEKDVKRVPSIVAGERSTFLALGTVDAYVDFTGLGSAALEVSDDGSAVELTLPPAQLSPTRLDLQNSRLLDRERGVLNRLGGVFSDDPTSERELNLAAERQIGRAAQDAGLQERAQDNTREMLTGLLGALGYTEVTVRFTPDGRP